MNEWKRYKGSPSVSLYFSSFHLGHRPRTQKINRHLAQSQGVFFWFLRYVARLIHVSNFSKVVNEKMEKDIITFRQFILVKWKKEIILVVCISVSFSPFHNNCPDLMYFLIKMLTWQRIGRGSKLDSFYINSTKTFVWVQ